MVHLDRDWGNGRLFFLFKDMKYHGSMWEAIFFGVGLQNNIERLGRS